MKKLIAILMVALLALTGTCAFAATYSHDDDITFQYDESYFTISNEEHTDDAHSIVLSHEDNESVQIYLAEMNDGEKFPAVEDFKELEEALGMKVEALETWANFKNVLTYTVDEGDHSETLFIAPIYDDDGEIEATLTVTIGTDKIEDEEAATLSSDKISDIVDTLKVDD